MGDTLSTARRTAGSPVRADRHWRWLRHLLALGWLVVATVALVYGARPSSLAELEAGIVDGDVTVVEVAGSLPPGSTGYSVVELQWRDGWGRHRAEVVEARPRSEAPAARSDERRLQVVGESVDARLTALDPDVRVVHTWFEGSYAEFLGWRAPTWTGFAGLGLFVGTAVVLISGPPPWRATRWAWFWLLFLATPLGAPAFLLLGGPTPGLPTPSPTGRRLTGGWALLLAVVLFNGLR